MPDAFKDDASYNEENKKHFHMAGRKLLRHVQMKLGTNYGQSAIRSNRGGIAVAGEIILHAEGVYVQVFRNWNGNGTDVMYRSCKGLKDYTGGMNRYVTNVDKDSADLIARSIESIIPALVHTT